MSDPALGLTMLCLIIVVIMMGFPTAFTLMGLGMAFGFTAFYDPSQPWLDNRVFNLMVQRTYGAMTNDTLLSIPLFVLMGYVMERGALVDKMFHSVQLAFRRLPGSLAVATLVICTFWGIASGLVGAVVVLMGVIAMRPMLNAGYDTRLAAGVITAGGTLGILIPPSVMIIVYAAVAGQSVVKLYAAAMFPGFFLALLVVMRRRAAAASAAASAARTAPVVAPESDYVAFEPLETLPTPPWTGSSALVAEEAVRESAEEEYDFLTDAESAALQTRLDLAQAYIDMQETDLAKELLRTVVARGNAEQRTQASSLLDSLA